MFMLIVVYDVISIFMKFYTSFEGILQDHRYVNPYYTDLESHLYDSLDFDNLFLYLKTTYKNAPSPSFEPCTIHKRARVRVLLRYMFSRSIFSILSVIMCVNGFTINIMKSLFLFVKLHVISYI